MNFGHLLPPLSRPVRIFFKIFTVLVVLSLIASFFDAQSSDKAASIVSGLGMPLFVILTIPLGLVTLAAAYLFLSTGSGLFDKKYFVSDKNETVRLIVGRIVFFLPAFVVLATGTYLLFYSFFNYIGIHINL